MGSIGGQPMVQYQQQTQQVYQQSLGLQQVCPDPLIKQV